MSAQGDKHLNRNGRSMQIATVDSLGETDCWFPIPPQESTKRIGRIYGGKDGPRAEGLTAATASKIEAPASPSSVGPIFCIKQHS